MKLGSLSSKTIVISVIKAGQSEIKPYGQARSAVVAPYWYLSLSTPVGSRRGREKALESVGTNEPVINWKISYR